MTQRNEVLNDRVFWEALEYASCDVMRTGDDSLRRFWVDGFLPEAAENTGLGVDIFGGVWLGHGRAQQTLHRFVASIPQSMLHGHRDTFTIEAMSFDEPSGLLRLSINPKARGS